MYVLQNIGKCPPSTISTYKIKQEHKKASDHIISESDVLGEILGSSYFSALYVTTICLAGNMHTHIVHVHAT